MNITIKINMFYTRRQLHVKQEEVEEVIKKVDFTMFAKIN